jgi:hypothetical protein
VMISLSACIHQSRNKNLHLNILLHSYCFTYYIFQTNLLYPGVLKQPHRTTTRYKYLDWPAHCVMLSLSAKKKAK